MRIYLTLISIVAVFLCSCQHGNINTEVVVTNETNRDKNIMLQHLCTEYNSFLVQLNEPIRDALQIPILLLKDGKKFKYDMNNEFSGMSLHNDNVIPKKGEEELLVNYYSKIWINAYNTNLDYLTIKDAPKKSRRYSFDAKNDETYSGAYVDVPKTGWFPMQLRILSNVKHPNYAIPLFCYIELEHEVDNVDDVKIKDLKDIWKLSFKRNIIVVFLVKSKDYSRFLEKARELSNSVQPSTNPKED